MNVLVVVQKLKILEITSIEKVYKIEGKFADYCKCSFIGSHTPEILG